MVSPLSRPRDGDIQHGWRLEVAATVTFLCAFLAVGLRIFARVRYARLGWDDHIMVFALVSQYSVPLPATF